MEVTRRNPENILKNLNYVFGEYHITV